MNRAVVPFIFLFFTCGNCEHTNTDTLTSMLSDGRKVLLFPGGKWIFTQIDSAKNRVDTIPGRRSFSHPPFSSVQFSDYFLESITDKGKNATVIQINLKLQDKPHELYLTSFFEQKGRNHLTPSFVDIGFISVSEGWKFLKNTGLIIIADGKRINLGKLERNSHAGNGYVMEHLNTTISLETFLAIINSDSVEGKLHTAEFKLSASQLEALRDYASRMR